MHFNRAATYASRDFVRFDFTLAGNRARSIWHSGEKWDGEGANPPTKAGRDTNAIPLSRPQQQIQRRVVDKNHRISAGNLTFVRNWVDLQRPPTNWGSLFISALRTLVKEGSREIPNLAREDIEMNGRSSAGGNATNVVLAKI